jgi:hypothetical protein
VHQIESPGRGDFGQDRGFDLSAAAPNTIQGRAATVFGRETEAEARQANVLTKDEARRIAINVAKLPELVGA